MTTPKNVIRKFPPFAAFQKFLVSETSVGNISRQEVVSMIPPLLMDLRPGMTVLDMCAAPGSKAAQLLEMIHVGEEARVRKTLRAFAQEDGLDLGAETQDEIDADLDADPTDAGRATGLLIANDADYKRGHMLVHQLKRLSSPNLIVTNHDATQFPSIKLPSDPNSTKAKYLKFDRILADVPCSGDGTLRKNANLWKDWQPGSALGLHTTQIRILVRALQLLKVGGRVVFSTCSMNPVENESVVVSAIERCGGPDNVEIVDCANELKELKRNPGMKSWKIMDKSAKIWSSWKEVEDYSNEHNEGVTPGRVAETMFPRLEGAQCANLPLERCMRVYAHMQDTGGFFITVLQKKAEFKAKNENEAKASLAAEYAGTETKQGDVPVPDDSTNGNKRPLEAEESEEQPSKKAKTDESEPPIAAPETKSEEVAMTDDSTENKKPSETEKTEEQPAGNAKVEDSEPSTAATPVSQPKPENGGKRRNGPIEEPFKYLDPSHPIISNIKEFYHISTRFPDDRYMVRNEMGEPAKAIYYTSALMRDILKENEGRGIKFIHGGVRMYMKQDAPSAEVCRWRIQAEGMPILQGYVGEPRVIHLRNKETFHKLLIEMFPRISDNNWEKFDEIGERVRDIGMGCCVLRIEPDGSDPDFNERMALPLWKSIQSLNLMLPKEDRSAMLLRVFNDTSPLINISLSKQDPNQNTPKEGTETAEEVEKPEEAEKVDVAEEAAIEGPTNGEAKVETEE